MSTPLNISKLRRGEALCFQLVPSFAPFKLLLRRQSLRWVLRIVWLEASHGQMCLEISAHLTFTSLV